MIPLELRLTNFLSYRKPSVVDLRDVHLACISGPNGAGKSTLLDAMTWALFGKSRARADDDLIHTVAAADGDAAEVELLFDMEGVVYRVIRRKRFRKGTELEFQVGQEAQDKLHWHSLTEAGIRDTEAAIERVLRMNYDVFVNASFFLQGQADEFTKRTPGKRKEILAEVLGVTQWDAYSKQAAAVRKQSETEGEILRRRLEEVAAELAESEERQHSLEAALVQQAAVQERLDEKEQFLQQARQVQSLLTQQRRQVEAQAKELAELAAELTRLEERIATRKAELSEHEAIVARADEIEASFEAWQAADAEYQQWQAVAEQRHRLLGEQNPLQLRITAARSGLEQRLRGLDAQQAEIAAGEAQLPELQAALVSAREQLATLSQNAEELAAKDAELRVLEVEIERLAGERKQREQEYERLRGELARVEAARSERETAETTLTTERQRAENLATELAAVAELSIQAAGWTAERDELVRKREELTATAQEEKERIERLKAEEGADCPLCGRPLTTDHLTVVVAQLQADLDAKRTAYRQAQERESELKTLLSEGADLSTRRTRLQREVDTQQNRVAAAAARLQTLDQAIAVWEESKGEAQLAGLKKWLDEQIPLADKKARMEALKPAAAAKAELDRERSARQQTVTRTESALEQINRQVSHWRAKGEPELVAVREQLAAESFATAERAQLAELEVRIEALGYDAAKHEAAQHQRQALSEAPAHHQALRQAQATLKPLKEALDESLQQQREREARHTALVVQHETDAAALKELQASAVDADALEREVIRLREDLSLASQTVGATRQKVTVLEDRRRQKKQLEAEQSALARRVQQLKLLEEACGRNGVQALLIEHALPEIEERANELLDRLSGGAMHVRFETQRTLKSRDAVAETLDIHISDMAGIRPYENYSGGEQFRVNFAVRLALSQVLAHRAGARLRTLVIDEGFGSQDPEGRQRLVEAINAVQSDFERILVITHIDELRDAFPARIEVTKAADGSHVTVVGGL